MSRAATRSLAATVFLLLCGEASWSQPPEEVPLTPTGPPPDLRPAEVEVLWEDSFEQGQGGQPEGWGVWGRPAESAWSGVHVHTGRRAVKLRGTTGPDGGWQYVGWLGRPFDVEAGFVYLLRAWAKTDQATGHTYLTIAWFDRAGQWLGNAPRSFVLGGTLDWTELLCLGVPPRGAARGLLHLRSDANTGRAWFDDAQLARTRGGIVVMPVPNASFEVGNQDTAAWNKMGQGTLVWSQDCAQEGKAAVSIAQSAWGTSWFSADFDVNAPDPWRVWFRAAAQAHPIQAFGRNRVALAWFDPEKWLHNTEGEDLPQSDGEWFALTVTGAPPPGAQRAQIHLRADANPGRVWFDAVRLEVLLAPAEGK